MADFGKPALTVGTIGHAGDGKTQLLAAITQVLAKEPGCSATPTTVAELDRLSSQTRAGHTRLLFPDGTLQRAAIGYESTARRYAHLDTPGRRSLIRSAARGVSILDAAILVISAEDGVREQTREHMLLARCAGVRHFVVFLNKCDVADAATTDEVELEVRRTFEEYDLDGDDVRVIRGSASLAPDGEPWRSGIVSLIEALDTEVPLPARDRDGTALFRIDELFGGHRGVTRTLAAGRVERGTIQTGEWYDLLGFGDRDRAKVESIEVFHSGVSSADAGEQIGVRMSGLTARTYERGQVLALAKSSSDSARFTAEIGVLTQDQGGRHTPIFSGHQAYFHLATAGMTGVMRWEGATGIAPGGRMLVNVELIRPVQLEVGMPLAFRDGCDGFRRRFGGPPRWGGTAGFGRVTAVE